MALVFKFNEEKNQLLKATRGVGFDEIIAGIENGNLVADIAHPNQAYAHQRIYAVRLNSYVYVVPYVMNKQHTEVFLKTAYPSRVLTKRFIQGDTNANQ